MHLIGSYVIITAAMFLYAATISVSAFLLFQIQPMIAKMILPWFGGAASVWITAMLFFQTALLGGYLYAHWLVNSQRPRLQFAVHMLLVGASLLLLPVAPSAAWKPSGTGDPILGILGLLTVSVGLPYFLLSTTSPLVQAWYARKHQAALPYRLFGLSNLASLLGLLAYPVFVEPNTTLHEQSWGWSAGYAVFAVLIALAAFSSRNTEAPAACPPPEDNARTDCPAPTVRNQVMWLLLAASASTLLLAVTNHLTQNVASIPFLWVLPLSLYLLTFIVAFDYERLYQRNVFAWLMIAALCGMAWGISHWNSHTNLRIVIPSYSAGLFICCMFCHGELVKRKPAPRYLTSFYLMLSLGGALGGLLVGIVAPKFLPGTFEFPLALVGCAALLLIVTNVRVWPVTAAAALGAFIAILVAAGLYFTSYRDSALVMVRNFYGGLRVNEVEAGTNNETRMLVHGTVDHGMEFMAPGRRREHITYYGPGAGISLAISSLRHSPMHIGVIGLGAGSLAAFAEPGDAIRFYEINPLVEDLARRDFYYLAECRGKADVVLGDGRLSLEREPADQEYDLIAVDAFSGDAVPVHLLSRQALELYFQHLKPTGIVAFNITNTHLDLAPVVVNLAAALGKHAVIVSNEPDDRRRIYRSRWALVSSAPVTSPAILAVAEKPVPRPELGVWTDDYSNLFQILK